MGEREGERERERLKLSNISFTYVIVRANLSRNQIVKPIKYSIITTITSDIIAVAVI